MLHRLNRQALGQQSHRTRPSIARRAFESVEEDARVWAEGQKQVLRQKKLDAAAAEVRSVLFVALGQAGGSPTLYT